MAPRVTQHKLQRVLAWRQIYTRLSLSCHKMQVLLVLRDWLIASQRLVHVDKEMMMTSVLKVIAGVANPHVAQSTPTPECTP